MELTEAIKFQVGKKLMGVEKLVADFEPATARVEVGKTSRHHNKGEVFRSEINLDIRGGLLRAEAAGEDLYEAIDVAIAELRRQLVDAKERRQDRHRHGRPGKE